jgi:hypothetical protein
MNDLLMNSTNLDQLYLNDMIDEHHPEFDRLRDRFKNTPEGKRIEKFRSENVYYADGLQFFTNAKLDGVIRNESVSFAGDNLDRLGKIRAIRMHRDAVEDEKVKAMTTAERKAYLAEAEAERVATDEAARTRLDTAEHILQNKAKKDAKRSAFEQMRYERQEERRIQQAKNREFLIAERARREGKPNPVAARQAAIERREKAEKDLAETADAPADDVKTPNGHEDDANVGDTQVPVPALPEGSQEAPEASETAAPVLTREVRSAELHAMKGAGLNPLMEKHKIAVQIGMSNAQKADAILDAEFPSK